MDCIFEVSGRVPDFIVFGGITSPLGLVLEFSMVLSVVDCFFKFVFRFSFDNILWRGFFYL